jgi:hypothetical protein
MNMKSTEQIEKMLTSIMENVVDAREVIPTEENR